VAKKDLRDPFGLIGDLTGPNVSRPVRWCVTSGSALGFVGGLLWALLVDMPLYLQGVFVGLNTLGALVLGVIVGSVVERLVGARSAGKRKKPRRHDRRSQKAGRVADPKWKRAGIGRGRHVSPLNQPEPQPRPIDPPAGRQQCKA
jgi:hypothetical protein